MAKWLNRKTIWNIRIGQFRLKLERHVWEDDKRPENAMKKIGVSVKKGYEKGRK